MRTIRRWEFLLRVRGQKLQGSLMENENGVRTSRSREKDRPSTLPLCHEDGDQIMRCVSRTAHAQAHSRLRQFFGKHLGSAVRNAIRIEKALE
jgi:hypothetical protein